VKWVVLSAILLLATLIASTSVAGQEVAETIRIKTRVVFLDALLKIRRREFLFQIWRLKTLRCTTRVSFARSLTSRVKGQARKPLALVLILDLRDDGAGDS